MPILELSFASGESSLSVRRFSVNEAVSSLFSISVWARSESPSIDLEAIIWQPASLRVVSGWLFARLGGARLWTGIVSSIEQVQAVQPQPGAKELSTYALRIVPDLWMLTQRRNYRIFQHKSIPDIIDALLGEWSVEKAWKVDRGKYPKLEYKVQYGESDFAFFSRLLEEAGIAYTFPDDDAKGSKLTLSDKLQAGEVRPGGPLHYVDNPNQEAEKEFVSSVRLLHSVRPGAHTIRDYDFRNPSFELFGEAPKAKPPEDKYEQYHYEPGGFLVETGKGGGTPVADDKGTARHDQAFGKDRAARLLGGTRADRRQVSFDTNTVD
ncbi:MAG TPA: phage late control D family protein, partial [Polyangiaceae bacterium]|nr:phage late control D family protein [Polyangiaceae bacterium]